MAPASGFRTFVVIYSGQSVSLIGSALASFALTVYVYQRSGSVTTLGFAFALFLLPTILFSPIAGSLVDRWGSRRALLVSNAGAMFLVLILAMLFVTDTLAIWHIYVFVVISSSLRALQMPAFESTVPLLVPKRHIGRANGMRLVATAASETAAPLTAGILLLAIGVEGIVVMDCLSFGFAILTLLFVRVPRAQGADDRLITGLPSMLRAFHEAWLYVAARQGFVAFIGFLAAISFASGFVDLLHTPLVLAFTSPEALGTVLTVGGLGMVVTSLAMSAWGGPRRRIRGVLGFSLVLAAATVMGSVRPSVPLIALGAFVFLGSSAIIAGSVQSVWQTKVEPRLLGRAMALKNMILLTPQFLGILVAGPAADHVFEPLVGRDQVRSPVVAALVGDGPGRGIALLLMLMGVLIAVAVVVAYLHPHLRHLEDEVPDAIPDPESAADEPAAARL